VAVVACAVALPLAVASAGEFGDRGRAGASSAARTEPRGDDKVLSAESRLPRSTPVQLGLGLATAARCGPEVSSPEGVVAQTCVLT
jgi:hypothetical protein